MSGWCELPDFFREELPRARQQYVCCECHQPIPVGMKHWKCTGRWPSAYDSKVETFRQHIECRDACYTFQQYDMGECIGFGELREEMGNAGFTGYECFDTLEERQEFNRKRHADPESQESICRNYLAAGIRASRLKGDQIHEYNKKHAGRQP